MNFPAGKCFKCLHILSSKDNKPTGSEKGRAVARTDESAKSDKLRGCQNKGRQRRKESTVESGQEGYCPKGNKAEGIESISVL